METNTPPALEPIGITAIATRLGRHYTGVRNVIERLGIKPVVCSGPFKFFDPSVVDQIGKAMRTKNKSKAS